jgi:hypothetical protein
MALPVFPPYPILESQLGQAKRNAKKQDEKSATRECEAQCEEARREKARREKAQLIEVLLVKAEVQILRFEALRPEALRPNSLLPKKAQLVALQLKEVQLVQLVELVELRVWSELGLFEYLFGEFRLEDLLRKLLRRVELILTELRQREELIYRFLSGFLAMLWQKLLESLLFSHNVSKLPNKHRPPCITMPWNIRLALVVLWGVCWMFNPWNPIDDIQLQPLSADEQTLFSSGKVFPHSNAHFVQLTFLRRY